VATPKQLAHARRLATGIHVSLGVDIRRLREDVALTRRLLADAAGIDVTFLRRIEEGRARASHDTYARLAAALGADLTSRLYPNTGPSIRDRFQAPILESLLHLLHHRWQPFPEVAVRNPARGWIDVVLHAAHAGEVVATEIQSDLRRVEQLLRWFPEKVASLSSWEGWAQLGPVGEPSRLLVVRSTRATRQIGQAFARQLQAAYPAHPADALTALRGTSSWPGPALVWAVIERDRVRFLEHR
jgi:transcriptional regulator with XRE-family HTH domain